MLGRIARPDCAPTIRTGTFTKHTDTDMIHERRYCTTREKVSWRFLRGRGPIFDSFSLGCADC